VGGGDGFETPFRLPDNLKCAGHRLRWASNQSARPEEYPELTKQGGRQRSPTLEGKSFGERNVELGAIGVFTLPDSGTDEFKALDVIRANQEAASRDVGGSKVRKARYIADTFDCPPEVDELLRSIS